MPSFGPKSLAHLQGCDERLVRVFLTVVKHFDCQVLDGARTAEEQAANLKRGVSKTLDSKHVVSAEHPKARAVDVAPYPVIWPDPKSPTYVKDLGRWYYFGGYVLGIAEYLGVNLRWGGDWASNRVLHDQSFDDLPHFEVRE